MMRCGSPIWLALLAISLSLTAQAQEAGMRCGDTIIDPGDSRARVQYHCGEPFQRESVGYAGSKEDGTVLELNIEVWTYDRTRDRFDIVTFIGNRVKNIESEKK